MSSRTMKSTALSAVCCALLLAPATAQDLETLRPVADQGAAERAKLAQVMVDSIFSSGSPVIALGSDIDGIPKSSPKPGIAYHDPMIEGAPG